TSRYAVPSLILSLFPLCPPPVSTLFPYTTLFRSRVSEGVRLPCRRCSSRLLRGDVKYAIHADGYSEQHHQACDGHGNPDTPRFLDRKSTRLNSSHLGISYAVFCLKKKT